MVVSKLVPKAGDNVDIGCGNAFGSTDAEGEEGGAAPADNTPQMVNNVVDKFSYTQTDLDVAGFKGWLKEFMNQLLEKMKAKNVPVDDRKAFRERAANIGKFLLTNFKDLEFYLGPSFCPDSMIFSIYPEGATAPNFYYIMDGLDRQKF
jgi:hypothetical protein